MMADEMIIVLDSSSDEVICNQESNSNKANLNGIHPLL